MSVIRDVVSRALVAAGAVVDTVEPDGIEVVAPSELAAALELDEFSRLGFGVGLPADVIPVNFESEWIDRLDKLLGARGTYLVIDDPASVPAARAHSPRDLLTKAVVLDNATYRYQSCEPARAHYLLLIFRLIAVSDEKREELLTLCMNESNGADAEHMVNPVLDAVRAGRFARFVNEAGTASSLGTPAGCRRHEPGQAYSPDGDGVPWTSAQAGDWSGRNLPTRIRSKLQPFLSGMERRMARDMERLHAYHTNLRHEAAQRIREAERKHKADDKLRHREELRIESIEREYQAKVADVRLKYAMNVEVSFLQALRLTTPVYRLRFNILRRKGVRAYHLDWNALSHHLDRLPCEGCGRPSSCHAVCDERLHILCPGCLAPCPSCEKPFCRACHPDACPRCKTRL